MRVLHWRLSNNPPEHLRYDLSSTAFATRNSRDPLHPNSKTALPEYGPPNEPDFRWSVVTPSGARGTVTWNARPADVHRSTRAEVALEEACGDLPEGRLGTFRPDF